MNTEGSTTKLILNPNTSNSVSTTPTSSSSPVTVNGGDHQQQLISNGNGLINDGKLTSTNYQNGILPDLQATYHGSSWSNAIDSLSGSSGDHPFDVYSGTRMFSPQTTPPPLMAMQQQQVSYQQVI